MAMIGDWWLVIDDDNGDPATYGRIHKLDKLDSFIQYRIDTKRLSRQKKKFEIHLPVH